MADLTYIQAAQEVKILGQDATGNQVNFVGADTNGNMLVKDAADGPTTPGTAASFSTLIGGVFNTALPTLTTGQQSAFQFDSSARVIIAPLTNSSIVKAQLQDNAGTALTSSLIGAKQGLDVNILLADRNQTGTIAALNANVAVNSSGSGSVVITITGTWSANLAMQGFDGTNWISATGLTLPAGGITSALSSNGSILINCAGFAQIRVIATAYTSGTANIFMNVGVGTSLVEVYNDSQNPLIIAGKGTAGAPDSAVTTIQGISGGTNIPVSQATAANLNAQVVGPVADGAVASGNPVQIGGKDGSGNIQTLATDTGGNLSISTRIPLTASAPTTASIGVASTTVIAANANRKGLVLTNTSSLARVSLNLVGGSAVLDSGITLYPHDIFYMDAFTFTTAQINAISSIAATPVGIQELA